MRNFVWTMALPPKLSCVHPVFGLVLLICLTRFITDAFVVGRREILSKDHHHGHSCRIPRSSSSSVLASGCLLRMGLYDTPLPQRQDDDDENLEEAALLASIPRLFEMQSDGTEARGFLPKLARSLTKSAKDDTSTGMDASNRNVKLLVEKTNCSTDDAAWALEACNEDLVRAWECISIARRTLLQEAKEAMLSQEEQQQEQEDDWDADLFSMMEKTHEEEEETNSALPLQSIMMDKSKPDQQWLPGKPNPQPVDDEPWFTG